jgi:hypothetical protein
MEEVFLTLQKEGTNENNQGGEKKTRRNKKTGTRKKERIRGS